MHEPFFSGTSIMYQSNQSVSVRFVILVWSRWLETNLVVGCCCYLSLALRLASQMFSFHLCSFFIFTDMHVMNQLFFWSVTLLSCMVWFSNVPKIVFKLWCQDGTDVRETAQVYGNTRVFHDTFVGVDTRSSWYVEISDDTRRSEGEICSLWVEAYLCLVGGDIAGVWNLCNMDIW